MIIHKEQKALILKKKVWNIVNAYVKSEYKAACKELGKFSPGGLLWLKNVPKETWTIAILKTLVYVICYITIILDH